MSISAKVVKNRKHSGTNLNNKFRYSVSYDNIFTYSFIILISLFLIVIPFYRGLYFRENYIPAIIYLSCIFVFHMVYKLLRKDYQLINSYLDVFIMILPVVYLISFFFSINAKLAFDAVLKYAAYFMIFKIVGDLCRGYIEKRIMLYALIISNYIIAITGLLTMAGIIDLAGVVLYNRIYGLYQYPNTTGAILGAGFLLGIFLLSKAKTLFEKLFLQIINTTILSAFILTLSLGAYIVFAGVALLFFIIVSVRIKLSVFINVIIALLSNSFVFISYFQTGLKESFITYYLISVILSLILQWIFHLITVKYFEKQDDKKISVVLIFTVVLLLLSLVAFSVLEADMIKPLLTKLWDSGLKLQNASDRIIFSKDGLKIFLDNPIIGTGGGTWQDVYYKYQSFPYNSAEAHNFYVQFLTEVGIIGGIVFISILFLLVKQFITERFIKRDDTNMPIFAAIFMIIGHAFIDFDLSLSAPMFLLWCLVGIVNSNSNSEGNLLKKLSTVNYAVLGLSLVILYFSTSVFIGMANGNRGAQIVNKDADKAVAYYEKAMKYDRFNGAYRMDYAQLMGNKFLSTKDSSYLESVKKALSEIEKFEPQNIRYIAMRINLLISYGELQKGVELANRLVEMQPLVESAYENKIQVNYQIAKYYYSKQQFKEALPYLDNMIETEKQLEAAKAKSIKPFEVKKNIYDMIKLAKNWKGHAEKRIQG